MKTMLSTRASVADYKKMEKSRDRKAIADFMQHRMSERYIDLMRVDPEKRNGFTIMAVSCLLIETLESFIQGGPDTKNKSQLAFCNFLIVMGVFIHFAVRRRISINTLDAEFSIKVKALEGGTFVETGLFLTRRQERLMQKGFTMKLRRF